MSLPLGNLLTALGEEKIRLEAQLAQLVAIETGIAARQPSTIKPPSENTAEQAELATAIANVDFQITTLTAP